jgi:hypothetical protein
MKPLITVFEEYELIETETMKKSRLVREFEVIEVSFCFSSLKRFETFVEVTEYEKHGVNAPIWQKLGKQERLALGTTLPNKRFNPDLLCYRVNTLARDI